MNNYIIVDFDGTLFNTLPPTYKIMKNKVQDLGEKIQYHKNYIQSSNQKLKETAALWTDFFDRLSSLFIFNLISETPFEIISLYLEEFKLSQYFDNIYPLLIHKSGERKCFLQNLIDQPETQQLFLVSDSPKDLSMKAEKLFTVDSRSFFSDLENSLELNLKALLSQVTLN